MGKVFFDSNVLLYGLSQDASKAQTAEDLLEQGGTISVQILNEMAHVAKRKLAMPWVDIQEWLHIVQALCTVEPLTLQTHERGLALAQRYGLSLYDALIAAAALLAECKILYSEDMQDGLLIGGQLRVKNPFGCKQAFNKQILNPDTAPTSTT